MILTNFHVVRDAAKKLHVDITDSTSVERIKQIFALNTGNDLILSLGSSARRNSCK